VSLQPISVAIEADQSSFQMYAGGVLEDACGTNLDHGVLLTGYGSLKGKKFWRVKNSWGADWGDQGASRLRAYFEQLQTARAAA
jgi:C1A family cysteine protease